MKLLLIEDDIEITATLKEELEKDYIVETSSTGEDGAYQAHINEYDLIILDLGLPDLDGREVCKNILANRSDIPILILTGEHATRTKVSLLDLGAEDYLTKPFKFDELKARIRVLLRRKYPGFTTNTLSVEDLTLDLSTKIARRGMRVLKLRRKEFHLLEYLVRNAGKVLSRGMIFDHVWNSNAEFLTNVVDVHIKHLRDQLDKPFDKKLIKTIHGLGYKIEA